MSHPLNATPDGAATYNPDGSEAVLADKLGGAVQEYRQAIIVEQAATEAHAKAVAEMKRAQEALHSSTQRKGNARAKVDAMVEELARTDNA